MNYDNTKAKLIEDEDFKSSCNFLPNVKTNPLHINFIMNSENKRLLVGLTAKLELHCISIAQARFSIPFRLEFFKSSFTALSSVLICDIKSTLYLTPQFKYKWHLHKIKKKWHNDFYLLQVIMMSSHNDHLLVGLITQQVENCTDIAQAKVQISSSPEFFKISLLLTSRWGS